MRSVSEEINEVKIFGYLPPPSCGRQTKWCLTVFEDGKGVPERYPKFWPEQELMIRLCVMCSKSLFMCSYAVMHILKQYGYIFYNIIYHVIQRWKCLMYRWLFGIWCFTNL